MSHKTLVFDSEYSGHHQEYLENIIAWLAETSTKEAIILCHPALSGPLEQIKADTCSPVSLRYLSNEEVQTISKAKSRSALMMGLAELRMVQERAKNWPLDTIVFLNLNRLQLCLAKDNISKSIRIRGILFSPFIPLSRVARITQGCRIALINLRKVLQLRYFLKNPRIESIYILNDRRVADILNRKFSRKDTFKVIGDPIPIRFEHPSAAVNKSTFQSDLKRFLLFGSLSPRKGVMEFLRAVSRLSKTDLENSSFRIIGSFYGFKTYEQACRAYIEELQKSSKDLRISIHPERVSFEDLQDELSSTDYLVAPYLGFYGSSGVIGHACLHGKPVLSCSQGLIGEIVRENSLGTTMEPRDTTEFTSILSQAIAGKITLDPEKAKALAERGDPRRFAGDLLL